jgi:hydrogenase maturation protein HypF
MTLLGAAATDGTHRASDQTRSTARRRLIVTGIVQGVGFRPFVYTLGRQLGLTGFVGNDASGVFIEIEGPAEALDRFGARLLAELPPLAEIDQVRATELEVLDSDAFTIVESTDASGPRTIVPPDVATCDDCLAELDDPGDRRHRYPFVNCTNCGPRFTIIRDLPYDRPSTTMSGFPMCPSCSEEYRDPTDRRYHAQPVACPVCGPQLHFVSGDEHRDGTDEVITAVHDVFAHGGIVAVKGLGGYHLACDAGNPSAIGTLRTRKGRSDKPFALMVPDLPAAEALADLDPAERAALCSPARPIVLARARIDDDRVRRICEAVAPGNPLIGIMLAYTPLHHLLFRPVPGTDTEIPAVLVMTSGNRSDEPICIDDDDAIRRLADLADAFCTHDRPIELPCDDSVVRIVDGAVQPIRRSRGYAPVPVRLPFEVPDVLAVGGELKNTCCVASGRHAWVGQHVGDMENLATLQAFETSVAAFTRMYRVSPTAVGVDRHPGYLTRRWALERSGAAPVVDVQHHHAHVASVMAEHGLGLDAEVLGIAFDGTGFGDGADGRPQIWGGEVLRGGYAAVERVAHLRPLPLPGGDEAVRNPCRIAVAALVELGIALDDDLAPVAACDDVERSVVPRQVERGVGCVPTTSMGRLFDMVSSLLDVRHRITYEAQAAIELEHLATAGDPTVFPLAFDLQHDSAGPTVVDPAPVIAGLIAALRAGVDRADLAAAFHHAVADVVGRLADHHAAGRPVALTGGVFQNSLLTRLVRERLAGHEVLTHRLVPPNDGGLSLGQAVVAAVATMDATTGVPQRRT